MLVSKQEYSMSSKMIKVGNTKFTYDLVEKDLVIETPEYEVILNQVDAEYFAEFIDEALIYSHKEETFELETEEGSVIEFEKRLDGTIEIFEESLNPTEIRTLFHFLLEHYEEHLNSNGWEEERTEASTAKKTKEYIQ